MDQPPRAVAAAGVDHVACPPDGSGFEVARAAAHRRTDVVDRRHACHGVVDDTRIAQVADDDLHPGVLDERRYLAPYQHPHPLVARTQCRHERAAEEAAGAGHQRVGRFQPAQAPLEFARPQTVGCNAGGFEQSRDPQGVLAAERRFGMVKHRKRELLHPALDAG